MVSASKAPPHFLPGYRYMFFFGVLECAEEP